MLGFMVLTFFRVFVCGNGKDSRGFQFVALGVTLLYARVRIVLFDWIILLKFSLCLVISNLPLIGNIKMHCNEAQ